MLPADIEITPFDIRNATDDELRPGSVLSNIGRAERLPGEPPIPFEEHRADWRNIPPFVDVYVWRACRRGSEEQIATAHVGCEKLEQNRHLAHFGVFVHPEYRRTGIGTALLHQVAEKARENGRTLLMTNSCDRVPAGEAFLQAIGSDRGLESHTNQLDIEADLDRALLEEWIRLGQERAADYDLILLEGPLPDGDAQSIVDMMNVVFNSMPRGDLKVEDTKFTVEHVRHWEASMAARGSARLTYIARHRPTGEFVGYTDVTRHPNRPYILNQGGTGVLPAHREKGLGRWMKAAMLLLALERWPEVQFVRTSNADRNAPMLAINNAMGFRHFMADIIWQTPTEKVFDYLAAKNVLK